MRSKEAHLRTATPSSSLDRARLAFEMVCIISDPPRDIFQSNGCSRVFKYLEDPDDIGVCGGCESASRLCVFCWLL
jgi:hypothetical protein